VDLEVRVDLSALGTAEARKGGLDTCLLPLWREAEAQAKNPSKSSEPHERLQVGRVQVGVRDVNVHRAALHAAVLKRLGAVSQATEVVQWQPEDLHCHSDGRIQVVSRGLDAVVLALDTGCQFVPPKTPQPAP
jgi:hypothetical protein